MVVRTTLSIQDHGGPPAAAWRSPARRTAQDPRWNAKVSNLSPGGMVSVTCPLPVTLLIGKISQVIILTDLCPAKAIKRHKRILPVSLFLAAEQRLTSPSRTVDNTTEGNRVDLGERERPTPSRRP
jgi:hypothetical protein